MKKEIIYYCYEQGLGGLFATMNKGVADVWCNLKKGSRYYQEMLLVETIENIITFSKRISPNGNFLPQEK